MSHWTQPEAKISFGRMQLKKIDTKEVVIWANELIYIPVCFLKVKHILKKSESKENPTLLHSESWK